MSFNQASYALGSYGTVLFLLNNFFAFCDFLSSQKFSILKDHSLKYSGVSLCLLFELLVWGNWYNHCTTALIWKVIVLVNNVFAILTGTVFLSIKKLVPNNMKRAPCNWTGSTFGKITNLTFFLQRNNVIQGKIKELETFLQTSYWSQTMLTSGNGSRFHMLQI